MIFVALPDTAPTQQRFQREYYDLMPPPAIMVAASGDSSASTPIAVEVENEAAVKIEVSLPDVEWTNALEREFHALAVASATGKSDAVDGKRLAVLQATRRRLKNPRTTEEIIAEYHARQTTKELAEALQKYVQFRNPKADPWTSAKANL